jgi:hypothetical protein
MPELGIRVFVPFTFLQGCVKPDIYSKWVASKVDTLALCDTFHVSPEIQGHYMGYRACHNHLITRSEQRQTTNAVAVSETKAAFVSAMFIHFYTHAQQMPDCPQSGARFMQC